MDFDRRWSTVVLPASALFTCLISVTALPAQDDFAAAVTATHPLAYYRLDATAGRSQVGTTTYKASAGVTSAAPGAPVGTASRFVKLDGRAGYVTTTQAGGIATAASILAWVDLADLPAKAGHILYVAGESQSGNDLDLQFEGDNQIRFFTAGGGNLAYAPSPATLVNQWHMIVVTLDTVSKVRTMYWDGKLVATDKGGGSPNKTSIFTIGESPVFSGRVFKGGIEEVALWNRPLKATEVTAIYSASNGTSSGGSTAASTGAGSTLFPSSAKVEIDDSKGHLKLKPEERVAYLFLSSIEMIQMDCQDKMKRSCSWDQVLTKLKYDPRTDPNYSYTLLANGSAWEAHATAKKPGLTGFCFLSKGWPSMTMATFNPSGTAGFVDTELGNRSVEGEGFQRPF